MFRAFLILGARLDGAIALFLIIVFGWILDSWHDRDPWAGPISTALWSISFALSAGAPLAAYWLHRRKSAPRLVAWTVWLPAALLVGITAIGLLISPP
jgi:hypothetical protein